MPESSENQKKVSSLEAELYLLIAKFLRTGPCKRTAEILKEELEVHQLLPKRTDWLGNEHNRTFNELDTLLSQIADDHLLKICSRIGPILDKDLPPTVSGLTSLLGVGRQSLLRTKEELEKPKCQLNSLAARKNGMPLFPSPAAQPTFPPNIAPVLTGREFSGAITSRHAFSPKIYARQNLFRRLLGHLSSVYCVLFDRTGKYIFTGADDLLVKIWSAMDGRLLAALRGHSAEITDMAVNYENTLLAAGSCDKTIRVWCLHTTAPVAVLNGHTGMVTSLQFCPYPKNRDQLLISTGNDGCICFWQWNPQTNVFNPKPLKFTERNKAGAQMICSSFSPGGLFLATGSTDHSVRVYNIAGLNGPEKILEREVHVDRVDSLQFSNRDCRFISGSKDGTALIWKYERQEWSSIQLKMTARLPGEISNEAEDAKLKLRVTMVGWTLDDGKVVTAVSDHSIKVWNSFNGTLCHILKGHEDEVFVLEAHPTDSRIFLSSGHDGRIILWDLVTGSIIKNHFNLIEGQGHGAVFDCKFSPDGLMFASTDSHGHLCIFGFGSNERYKKVPEEQFFHTDYRPLIRDIHHHVLDEQTQTAPHLLPPPFLVDIDGNPYPPHVQRLVPGRESCNDSQLIPYVAVSAEGESEILEPVRPANDASDRPTIDDMIERLQQEQHYRESSENGPQAGPSSDSMRSPQSSRRLQSTSDDRNAQEPFSPRTPRSQSGHSRVGLRRTGDVEGVQSVGNWQSRDNQGELPAWVKRVVVRPIATSLTKSYYQKRMNLANYELNFFSRELKKRQLPDPSIGKEQNERKRGSREGLRTSARGRSQEESFSNMYGEEFENPDRINMNTSTDTESEPNNDEVSDESSDDSGSGEYSDWIEDVGLTERNSKPKPVPPPSKPTSSRRKRMAACYNHSSDDEETDAENGEEEEAEERAPDQPHSSKHKHSKRGSAQTKMVNGKKVPERFRPPEWLTDVTPHKAPYVPQIGDEIVYFRQGHELYVQAVKRNRIYDIYMRSQPWRKINLRDTEVARIEDITFENHPPRLCCLKLVLLNPASKHTDTFTVKYHDMADVIDFIVLRQNYDQAMHYDWKPGDRFRSAIDKAWWLGTIKSQKPLNPHFPDSMFQCFLVKWDNGEKEHMSPWDFEPIDNERLPDEEGGSVDITPEERQAMMYIPEPHEWSKYGRDHDCDRISRGLARIMELSIAEPFTCPVDLNLYPSYAIVVEYPVDLGTIKARVQNHYYRRLDAVKFDVRYIALNARKFNEIGSRIVKQAKCVEELCIKFIESSHCADPMIIYHEMMEAKQSRSQDSQSELDVLCSESDSDGEQNTAKRLKRKKQNGMQQSSKRVRLGSQKYTSASWKQQCSALVDTIFQWEDSTPFRYPVDLNEYPDYRNIVDCPMDLSTVREKLNNNHYNSPIEFCKDMRLVFQNSRNYNTNKKSRIYSMTIRLSAMFEEHIRGIVSDWRSAVKYEEKIRNNQYVSSRRKPLPAQEGVNVGASTSRGFPPSLPSTSRGESSRHLVNKVMNSAFVEPPRNSHSSRVANGTGPKRVRVLKPSPHKRQHLNNSLGSLLTNGVGRKPMHRMSKRKFPEKSSKKRNENISKKEPSNTAGSRSDSNGTHPSSSPESSNGDAEWGRKSKRMRKDSSTKPSKKLLRTRNLTKHNKLSSSSLLSHQRKLRLRAQYSSPENSQVSLKKSPVKTTSPLHTRSKRHLRSKDINRPPIIHSLRERTQPRKYHNSSETSETDEHNQKIAGSSNSSSSLNTSTKNVETVSHVKRQGFFNESEAATDLEIQKHRRFTRNTAKLTLTVKGQESSNESEDVSDHEVQQKYRRPTRNSAKDNVKCHESSNQSEDSSEHGVQKYVRHTRNSSKYNVKTHESSNESEDNSFQTYRRPTRNSVKDNIKNHESSNESEDNSYHQVQTYRRPTRNSAKETIKNHESSNESEDNSDHKVQKHRRPTRNTAKDYKGQESSNQSEDSCDHEVRKRGRPARRKDNKQAARSALRISRAKRNATIQTRNRGERTVRYGEETDDDNVSPNNYDSENNEPVISFSSRGRLRSCGNNTVENGNDSIEENIFNGDTSLSETELNYSDTSTIVNEYVKSEDELEERYTAPQIKGRIRPRKRTKSSGINPVLSSYSACHTQSSLSLSGFTGSSRGGKYKMNLRSNRAGTSYRRKAMQGKVTLPHTSSGFDNSNTEKETVFKGRKRERKGKARKSCEIINGKVKSNGASLSLFHPFTFHSRILSLHPKLFPQNASRLLKVFRETRKMYQQMCIKKLGLNHRRKAMLCKIVLPILCVKNKFPSPGPKKHPGRGKWKKRKFGKNKSKSSRNDYFRAYSSSSNDLFMESSYDNSSRAFMSRSRGGWRNRIIKSSIVRNELLRTDSNSYSAMFKASVEAVSTESSEVFTTQSRGGWRKQKNQTKRSSSILRNELFKGNSTSSSSLLQKSSIDSENTHSSQASASQSKYNLKERKSKISYHETSRKKVNTMWNIKAEDSVQTRYQGQRVTTYEEGSNNSDWTEEWDSDNTLTYSSITSEETSILYYSDETEISSDTQSLSTQGFKDISENSDLHLQNEDSVNQIQVSSLRQTNSIYENVDVHCNNAMMCSTGSC